MDRAIPPTLGQHDAGSSVLVVGPALDAVETVEHVEAVRTGDRSHQAETETEGEGTRPAKTPPADTDRDTPPVVVSRTHTAESLLEAWRSQIGQFPSGLGIVSVGELTRSVGATSGTVTLPQAHIRTVATEDVTGLGLAIGDTLSQYDSSETPVLWFESLTPLLEEKGLEMTFRFLHVSLEQITRTDATAYIHVENGPHDEQTLTTLGHLFDDVIEL